MMGVTTGDEELPHTANQQAIPCSIVVSIPACHAGDPGSIPGGGATFFPLFSSAITNHFLFL
jgi:hypothetical protein